MQVGFYLLLLLMGTVIYLDIAKNSNNFERIRNFFSVTAEPALARRPILFTPGPTEVHAEVLQAMARPVISHRGAEMAGMVREILSGARRVFGTDGTVLLSTSSASGLMEGSIRNCVAKRPLHLICGAFGERWRQIAARLRDGSRSGAGGARGRG